MSDQSLDKHRRKVLEEAATEAPGTGKLLHNKQDGTYMCGKCGSELFLSDHKFESGSGWPSFYDLANDAAVELVHDSSHGMERTEAICASCKGHLGHVFADAFDQPTGNRFCINSAALDFIDKVGNKTHG